jgi:4-amino-4-deoxy-L-arabinose transferase-like glycosyltransferase
MAPGAFASARPNTWSDIAVWLREHAFAASALVFVCSISVRLFLALRAAPADLLVFYPDAQTYLGPAAMLLDRGAFLHQTGVPEIHRTPGYPALIAALMVLLGRNLRRVLIAQTFIVSLGPLALYSLARRSLPAVTALVAGLIAAFSPWTAVLAGVPLTDGVFLMLLSVIFLLLRITAGSPGWRAVLGAASLGALTAIAVLVRPVTPLVIMVPAAFLFYAGWRRRRSAGLALVILMTALAPVLAWSERNAAEGHFNGVSDIAGENAWLCLASRVRAELAGQSRHDFVAIAAKEEDSWGLPRWSQAVDQERWRRANAVFRAHPVLTAYSFARGALEHTIHPSPDVLTPARLNFPGDAIVLAMVWGALLLMSASGVWRLVGWGQSGEQCVDRRLLIAMLAVCSALTISSGITFAAGSRLRAPIEAVLPLVAAIGFFSVLRPSAEHGPDRLP